MVKKMFIPNYRKLLSSANPNNLIVLTGMTPEEAIKESKIDMSHNLGTRSKPRWGFWYSHPDAERSWADWNFLEGGAKVVEPVMKYLYEIKRPAMPSYRIDTIDKLIDFTLKFGIINDLAIYSIDWNKVASEYGIIDLDGFRLKQMAGNFNVRIPENHPRWQDFKDKDTGKERMWKEYEIDWFSGWDIDGGVIIRDFNVELVKILYAPKKEILELIEQNYNLKDKIMRLLDKKWLDDNMDPTTAGTDRYYSEWKEQLRRKKNADRR